MQASHPIRLIAVILSITLLCCVIVSLITTTSWFSFILFLIFLGGLIVLFIYISRLASNEKFLIDWARAIKSSIGILVSIIFTVANINYQYATNTPVNEIITLNSIYIKNSIAPIIFTIIYLLLTLVVVVKITSKYEGPLRNTTFLNK